MKPRAVAALAVVCGGVWLGARALDSALPEAVELASRRAALDEAEDALGRKREALESGHQSALRRATADAQQLAEERCKAQRDAERARAELACTTRLVDALEEDADPLLAQRLRALQSELDAALRQRRSAEEAAFGHRLELSALQSELTRVREERDQALAELAEAQRTRRSNRKLRGNP